MILTAHPIRQKIAQYAWMLALAASLLIRLYLMPEYMHGFRESQTAITVFWFNQEGISL